MRFLDNLNNSQLVDQAPGLELDYTLARGVSRGEVGALERMVERHTGAVCRYVKRRLPPGHDTLAEEITRDVFRLALRRVESYARGTTAVPMELWLLSLAGRLVQKRLKSLPSQSAQEGETVYYDLRESLGALKQARQHVIALALFEELDPAGIAASLGTSTPRAMKLLRKALRGVQHESSTWS